jgi:hypothetical protein
MSSFEEHCRRCEQLLGNAFPQVHRWLDEFFCQPPYGTRHRHLRHHRQGIEQVRRMWVDEAARAAEIHIRQDLEQEGWPADWPLPRDAEEFKKAGLW